MPIIENESNAEYHANTAISSSQAKLALTSIQLFKDGMDGLVKHEETPAMRFGTAVHAAVLEPEAFSSQYYIGAIDGRTKEGKAAKAEMQEKGLIILPQEDSDRIERMLNRMPKHVHDMLAPAKKELTIRVGSDRGEQCRFDALDVRDAYDLKSIANIDMAQKQIGNLLYWFSAGWYNMVYEKETGKPLRSWHWIFCETNPPYRWQVVELSHTLLSESTDRAYQISSDIHAAFTFDTWEDQPMPTFTWEPKPWDIPLLKGE